MMKRVGWLFVIATFVLFFVVAAHSRQEEHARQQEQRLEINTEIRKLEQRANRLAEQIRQAKARALARD